MSFRIGDKVVISFPEGTQFNVKDSAGKNCTAADMNGKQGVITGGSVVNREMHYVVEIEGFPPMRLFGRDLAVYIGEQPVNLAVELEKLDS